MPPSRYSRAPNAPASDAPQPSPGPNAPPSGPLHKVIGEILLSFTAIIGVVIIAIIVFLRVLFSKKLV